MGGHWEALKWATANGCPHWDEAICFHVAREGYLGALEWARANGFDWGEDTCSAAAECGHFGVLKGAISNGYDWCPHTCEGEARDAGHDEVVQLSQSSIRPIMRKHRP